MKYQVDEVVIGIYGLLLNNAADTEFTKSQYHSSTCTDSCNYGGNLKKSLVDLFLHRYRDTSIVDQSVLSRSMAPCDIKQLFNE